MDVDYDDNFVIISDIIFFNILLKGELFFMELLERGVRMLDSCDVLMYVMFLDLDDFSEVDNIFIGNYFKIMNRNKNMLSILLY